MLTRRDRAGAKRSVYPSDVHVQGIIRPRRDSDGVPCATRACSSVAIASTHTHTNRSTAALALTDALWSAWIHLISTCALALLEPCECVFVLSLLGASATLFAMAVIYLPPTSALNMLRFSTPPSNHSAHPSLNA